MSTQKVFSVNKFLGINESADGMTELKLGEASVIDNFYITDEYNLKTRPGIARYADLSIGGKIESAEVFYVDGEEYLFCVKDTSKEEQSYTLVVYAKGGDIVFQYSAKRITQVFTYKGDIYFFCFISGSGVKKILPLSNWECVDADLYIPLVLSGCAPAGGGAEIEPLNVLNYKFRVQFIADGESTDFVLPEMATSVHSVEVDPSAFHPDAVFPDTGEFGYYDSEKQSYIFYHPPLKNTVVDIYCQYFDLDLMRTSEFVSECLYHIHFNGATDTRVFFYGDGTNRCYYTGEPAHGNGLYIPAGNELAVDFSDSPITGLVRHYSSLLAFKPDGVDQITYEPVTLADGRVIAGFYLRPVSRAAGNAALGQTVLVDNNPRTFCHNSIYDWRFSSSYRDERAAKCISQKVQKTLAAVPRETEIIMCDDNENKTCYVFLNDNAGTILVNRYDLDVWTIYHSPLAANNSNGLVCKAFVFERKVCFVRGEYIYYFEPNVPYDVNEDASKANGVPFSATWESGYMSFGAAYKQKYSSNIWVSVLPEYGSKVELTAKTDRRDEYLVKCAGSPLFSFKTLDFSNMSFVLRSVPQIKRLKIKVKKFVYYKLLFKVADGAKATVLGYDQQVRYSSNVK